MSFIFSNLFSITTFASYFDRILRLYNRHDPAFYKVVAPVVSVLGF